MLFRIKEADFDASISDIDRAFDKIVKDISVKSKIWTSSEMHEAICCMVVKYDAKLSSSNC